MKKIIFTLFCCLFAFCFNVNAQFLNRLKQTVVDHTKDKVDEQAGEGTDKAIDKTESNFRNDKDENAEVTNTTSKNNTQVTNPSIGSSTTPSIHAYQNYDFVPGDTVLFADDFTEDQNGEFPAHWDLTKGQAVVNTVAGKPAFCFTDGNYFHVGPRIKKASYLTDPFTIEFDTYCDENNSEQGSPLLSLYYINKEGNSTYGNIQFNKGDLGGRGDVSLDAFPVNLSANLPEALRNNYPNNWHHIAVIYKNKQLKCYVDQYRVLVIPNLGCVPTAFAIEGGGDQDHPVVITNVRVALGGNMNMLGKKFTEKKNCNTRNHLRY